MEQDITLPSRVELVKRSIDSNAFIYNTGADAQAAAINPKMWDMRLRDYIRQALVVTPLGEQYDFTQPGSTWQVTIDEAPSAASALTETTDVSVASFTTRSVLFTPSEYGSRYQLSYAEAARSFFDVASRMTNKLGYAMALKKDKLAFTTIQGGATTTLIANGVAATALASTDTLNLTDITKAVAKIEGLFYHPKQLVISPKQKQQLMTQQAPTTLLKANEFGTAKAIQNGLLGEIYGLEVYQSTNVVGKDSNSNDAVVLGVSGTGEAAFGIAVKRLPMIETFRNIWGRFIDIVGTEEYDIQVLHPDAICLIRTYVS